VDGAGVMWKNKDDDDAYTLLDDTLRDIYFLYVTQSI